MIDELNRAIEQLLGRFDGPMRLRLLMQPAMAIFLAVRAGLKDARQKKPAFLWEVVTNAEERRKLIHSVWKDIGRLFIFAFLIDSVYQSMVLKYFYLPQALIVAVALAITPYIAVRGPVTRLWRRYHPPK